MINCLDCINGCTWKDWHIEREKNGISHITYCRDFKKEEKKGSFMRAKNILSMFL